MAECAQRDLYGLRGLRFSVGPWGYVSHSSWVTTVESCGHAAISVFALVRGCSTIIIYTVAVEYDSSGESKP